MRRRGTGGVAQPAGAKAHRSSGSGQEGWGSSLCAKPLCRAVRCSACRSETPGPCLCRTALRPCPASSALARPQRLSSEPQSSRGCPPAAGRTDGREARGGQSLAGGLPSGLPEQQDPSVSLAGLCDSRHLHEVREIASRVRENHSTVGNKMENSELQGSNT